MKFYCGIDLGSRKSHLCVIDAEGTVLLDRKVDNSIERILVLLQPFKPSLHVVIESTFNWYWIVDALVDAGLDVALAHTHGLAMITGAKVKTDRRDARALASLLRIGAVPKAFIYPKDDRPARDLVRRRLSIVRLRAGEYGSIRRLLLQHGLLGHTRYGATTMTDDDLAGLLDHELVRLHASQELERIALYSRQIEELERRLVSQVRDRALYRRLQTLPGVSTILGLTIMYETGSIERFASARHYSSYCRVVSGVSQSGTMSRRRGRQSKQGNPYLKLAFSQAAMTAVRYYESIRRRFEVQVNRHVGRCGRVIAYNTIAHKLAVAAFHVMRDGTDYREELLFGGENPSQVVIPDCVTGTAIPSQ